MQDRIARGMEGRNGARQIQIPVDLLPQFIYRLIRKGNNQDLIRRNLLLFHQIFHLCRNRCSLSRTCTGNHQTVVLITKNHPSLILIQANPGIHLLQNVVQIILFLHQLRLCTAIVPGIHPLRNLLIIRIQGSCFFRINSMFPAIFFQQFIFINRPEKLHGIRVFLNLRKIFFSRNIMAGMAQPFKKLFPFQQLRTFTGHFRQRLRLRFIFPEYVF